MTDDEKRLFALGKEQYLQSCYICHGINGEGVVPLAPPLVNSSCVLGSEQRLVRIVLQGMEGPVHVNGTKYEPPLTLREMPTLDSLSDTNIAAILTYVRRQWGHRSNPIRPSVVQQIRKETFERRIPWNETELLQFK